MPLKQETVLHFSFWLLRRISGTLYGKLKAIRIRGLNRLLLRLTNHGSLKKDFSSVSLIMQASAQTLVTLQWLEIVIYGTLIMYFLTKTGMPVILFLLMLLSGFPFARFLIIMKQCHGNSSKKSKTSRWAHQYQFITATMTRLSEM